MFWGVSLRGNLRCVPESTISDEQKSYSVETGGTMGKLGVLLKTCLFAWDIDVFWLLTERANLEHSYQIRYFGKNLPIFLGYWDVPLWYLLASWENDGLINRVVLLNNWISLEVHLFWIYLLHWNTWILGRMNLFLSLIKWPGKKKQSRVRKTYLSRTGQPVFTISRTGKKEHLF